MHSYFKKLAQESSLPSSSKSEISINEYCRVLSHVLLFSDTPPKFSWLRHCLMVWQMLPLHTNCLLKVLISPHPFQPCKKWFDLLWSFHHFYMYFELEEVATSVTCIVSHSWMCCVIALAERVVMPSGKQNHWFHWLSVWASQHWIGWLL